jgi:hypothetical protein
MTTFIEKLTDNQKLCTIKLMELKDEQLNKISDIMADVGTLVLGSVVLPVIFEKFILANAILGLLITCFLWISSVWLIKNEGMLI